MSRTIHRDLERFKFALQDLGFENIEKFWTIPGTRQTFHIRATINGVDILFLFDPKQRYIGGATQKQKLSFQRKVEWAEKEDFLLYCPNRSDTRIEMEIKLKGWLNQKNLINL